MPREFNDFVRPVAFVNADKFYILGYEGMLTEKVYFKKLRESPLFNNSGTIEIVPVLRKKKISMTKRNKSCSKTRKYQRLTIM